MKKCISVFLIIILTTLNCGVIWGGSNTESGEAKHYNVVFVMDSSASMKNTDPQGFRNESIELFMGLLTDGGNNVGSVVFSSGVNATSDISNIDGKKEKMVLSERIKQESPNGRTDIGGALKKAVEMLEKQGDKSLPSIIILLSDGKTSLKTEKATEESRKNRDEAVDKAADLGYKIYTICLNDKNTAEDIAEPQELQRISKATNGEFREVNNAEDLREVFNLYYQLIYSTEGILINEGFIPESGTLEIDFDVAEIGVQEVNIVIFGDSSHAKWDTCALTDPAGVKYEGTAMDEISYVSDTQTIIKMVKPKRGVWTLTVKGDADTPIKIYKMYNENLNIKTAIQNEKEDYVVGEKINFWAEMYEGETKVTDEEVYRESKVILEVSDGEGNQISSTETANISSDGMSLEFVPNELGTYYAKVKIDCGELSAESERFILNVGNATPVAKQTVIQKNIKIWPFLIQTDGTIDLSGVAEDKEDKILKYEVDSATWLDDEYTLEGDKLTIHKFNVSKGTFKMKAVDSQGAYCDFEVKVTTTNIGLITMIVLLALALIVIVGFFIWLKIQIGKPFMGQISVENIETGQIGSPMKNRGRIKLTAFQVGQTGLNQKSYFQATGNNYIYFISKKPVMADCIYNKSKKIKIEHNLDVRIFSDAEQTKGIIVHFLSYKEQGY